MRSLRRAALGCVLVAATLLLAAPAIAQNYGSETGELEITPGELTITIAGEGFNPDSTVLVRLGVNGDGEEIGTLRADDTGAIEGEFAVPVVDGEPAALVAIGQTADGATLTLSGSVGVGVGGEIPDLEPEATPDADGGGADGDVDGDPIDGPSTDGDGSGSSDDGDGTSATTIVLVILVVVLATALAAMLFVCRDHLPLLGGRAGATDAGASDVSLTSHPPDDDASPL